MASTRRLAAILAADVAGYSRLMGQDEEGTHERLQAHLRELVDPKIEEHRGRIVKNTGDGLLAEFASVVDAGRCAVEIQRAMIDREPDVPEDRRIRFRIGVNLGDVIAEEDDIFGDGVNVAARLEALAEPCGICISGTVRDHIGERLPYAFEDMGEQSVKNIARPVRVYAWRPEGVADVQTTSVPLAMPTRRARSILAPIGAALAAVLVIAIVTWWFWPMRSSPTATPAVAATTATGQPFVAPRLSIVVLPFANLSNDPDQQYFADGITEDLTTDLSRISHMLVISRDTAFTYKDKPVNARQIGRELGVRYVLEGSVRRSGNQIRINAQLIDAESDTHLWAERFDRDMGDMFALQDEITRGIAGALHAQLIAAEAARPTEHPDALDFILRGRAVASKEWTRDNYARAIDFFEQALALNPRSAEAQGLLANMLVNRVLRGQTDTAKADTAHADELVDRALATSPGNTFAHYVKGNILRIQGRCLEAIPEFETVISLNPNFHSAYANLGWCKFLTGSLEDVISLEEKALRLTVRGPFVLVLYQRIGTAHLLQSHYEDAIRWLKKARNATPWPAEVRSYLASAYALTGETEHAAAELAEARRLSPDDRYSSIARLKAVVHFREPKIQALYEATYFAGLRKAGMPEE
jgi:TolB-like protein/class 3 adenylate cyclase/Flp pilus assembly protein TadD